VSNDTTVGAGGGEIMFVAVEVESSLVSGKVSLDASLDESFSTTSTTAGLAVRGASSLLTSSSDIRRMGGSLDNPSGGIMELINNLVKQ